MADVKLSGGYSAGASSGGATVALSASAQGSGTEGSRDAAPTGTAQDGQAKPGAGGVAPSDGQVKAAVHGANQALAAIGTQLVFVFDDQEHHMSVKLLDVQTQKVVKQIPTKIMVDAAQALSEEATSGALVNTKA